MQITLCNTSDLKNKINKSISTVQTIDANITANTNNINPAFLVRHFVKCNYLQYDNKYYFINNVDKLASGMYILNCTLDVLTTYKDSILSSTIHATMSNKQTKNTKVSYDLPSEKLLITSISFPTTPFVDTSSGWSASNYVLQTIG